ncbi:MAG: hypothetical protein BA861_01165 [Desulfobacterales bacterium S3730MH5]|nr:MAG: hypothetical protein BA861_01165 [Desulfobacterales bacterium S3730MH5]
MDKQLLFSLFILKTNFVKSFSPKGGVRFESAFGFFSRKGIGRSICAEEKGDRIIFFSFSLRHPVSASIPRHWQRPLAGYVLVR